MSAISILLGLVIGGAATALALRPRLQALAAGAARAEELALALVRAQAGLEHERARAQESRGDMDRRQQAVEALLTPLREQLRRVDQQLLRLDQDRWETHGRLESQLKTLAQTGERVRLETGALVTALRKANARGQWGQMQLRRVLELAGMVGHCDFAEQVALSSEDGPLRPDVVVNLPGGKHVVVDAKAPLQAVLDAYEAQEESERERHLRAHARLLRTHVRTLSEKAYWSELPSSPEFVVLFLPGEHLYGAALEADPSLLEDAMARRVLIATPTTLLAILRAVAYAWQQERVVDSGQAMYELGRELARRLEKLSGLLTTLGIRLNSTVQAYNDAVGSYQARVLPATRRLAEHGPGLQESEPRAPEPLAVAARAVRDS